MRKSHKYWKNQHFIVVLYITPFNRLAASISQNTKYRNKGVLRVFLLITYDPQSEAKNSSHSWHSLVLCCKDLVILQHHDWLDRGWPLVIEVAESPRKFVFEISSLLTMLGSKSASNIFSLARDGDIVNLSSYDLYH